MKKISAFICALCAVTAFTATPYTVNAAENDYVYGTMDIPYSYFYKAELAGSANEYEVDAVSSATTTKWSKNKEGELFEGTFNQANDDGSGKILGVTYPVAVTKETLDAMGKDNFNFTEISGTPEAYKIVTVSDGKADFSAVQDSTPSKIEGGAKINTNTAWGDYLVDLLNKPEDMGAIYGAVIKTESGKSYGMRHLENIWRGEFAWSSGIKKTEPHGNELSFENFKDIMGETINEIVVITKNGYYTAETSLYVPVKFEGSVSVENADATSGKTAIKTENIPSDYEAVYSVNDLKISADGSTMNFENAVPGKYADLTASFTLTTDKMPAAYADGKIVKADGATDDEFANFMKNLSSVKVGEKSYNASGKGAVKIIGEDGTVDANASSRDTKVFEGADSYSVSVISAGYEKTLDFTFKTASEPEVTTTAVTTTAQVTTSVSTSSSKATTTAAKNDSSPKTGDTAGALVPALAFAAASAAVLSKKKRDR